MGREREGAHRVEACLGFGSIWLCFCRFGFSVLCFGLNILEILVSTRQQRRGRGSGGRGSVQRLCVCASVRV